MYKTQDGGEMRNMKKQKPLTKKELREQLESTKSNCLMLERRLSEEIIIQNGWTLLLDTLASMRSRIDDIMALLNYGINHTHDPE